MFNGQEIMEAAPLQEDFEQNKALLGQSGGTQANAHDQDAPSPTNNQVDLETFQRQVHGSSFLQNQLLENAASFLDVGEASASDAVKKNVRDNNPSHESGERIHQMKAYQEYSQKMGLTGTFSFKDDAEANEDATLHSQKDKQMMHGSSVTN